MDNAWARVAMNREIAGFSLVTFGEYVRRSGRGARNRAAEKILCGINDDAAMCAWELRPEKNVSGLVFREK